MVFVNFLMNPFPPGPPPIEKNPVLSEAWASCSAVTLQRTHDGEFARPLLGGDDLQGRRDGLDANNGLVGVIGSRNGELQVATHQQLWRHILQLQGGELRRRRRWRDASVETCSMCKMREATPRGHLHIDHVQSEQLNKIDDDDGVKRTSWGLHPNNQRK